MHKNTPLLLISSVIVATSPASALTPHHKDNDAQTTPHIQQVKLKDKIKNFLTPNKGKKIKKFVEKIVTKAAGNDAIRNFWGTMVPLSPANVHGREKRKERIKRISKKVIDYFRDEFSSSRHSSNDLPGGVAAIGAAGPAIGLGSVSSTGSWTLSRADIETLQVRLNNENVQGNIHVEGANGNTNYVNVDMQVSTYQGTDTVHSLNLEIQHNQFVRCTFDSQINGQIIEIIHNFDVPNETYAVLERIHDYNLENTMDSVEAPYVRPGTEELIQTQRNICTSVLAAVARTAGIEGIPVINF